MLNNNQFIGIRYRLKLDSNDFQCDNPLSLSKRINRVSELSEASNVLLKTQKMLCSITYRR